MKIKLIATAPTRLYTYPSKEQKLRENNKKLLMQNITPEIEKISRLVKDSVLRLFEQYVTK